MRSQLLALLLLIKEGLFLTRRLTVLASWSLLRATAWKVSIFITLSLSLSLSLYLSMLCLWVTESENGDETSALFGSLYFDPMQCDPC